jgi:NAD(P)-dependent dehydrogenase (short-subunit alcohol dehydrogenase family)
MLMAERFSQGAQNLNFQGTRVRADIMNSLQEKIVFLTGASHGIGRELALRLAREKARLAFCGRDREALEETARRVEKLTSTAPLFESFDLACERDLVAFYREVRSRMGVPDILINNAGFNSRKVLVWEMASEEFDAMMAVNLKAPFILLREAAPDMIARKSGHIVNILSTVCHFANEKMGVYTAAKRGLEGLMGVALKELRPYGVRVSAIYPGGVDTGFRPYPRPDYMRPESVAEAVCAVLCMPEDLVVHSFTFRPMVETNF